MVYSLVLIVLGYGLCAFAFYEAAHYGDTPVSEDSPSQTMMWVMAVGMLLMGSLGLVGLIARFFSGGKITVSNTTVTLPGPFWSPQPRTYQLADVVSNKLMTHYGAHYVEFKMKKGRFMVASTNFDSLDEFNRFLVEALPEETEKA